MKTAIYPGSFDPVTLGHLNIIKRAAACFDRLIVCVMINSKKQGMFTPEERVELLLNPGLETMFLASSEKYTYLSSTIVKEMARYGADLGEFLPREIVDDVNRRMQELQERKD